MTFFVEVMDRGRSTGSEYALRDDDIAVLFGRF
jgi:hypothetical protein